MKRVMLKIQELMPIYLVKLTTLSVLKTHQELMVVPSSHGKTLSILPMDKMMLSKLTVEHNKLYLAINLKTLIRIQQYFIMMQRSEERRVGKECRTGWEAEH